MHTVIDFRAHDEHEQREHDALELVVDEDMAARIRINTRNWHQRNGLEPMEASAVNTIRQESFWDRDPPPMRRIETPISRVSDPDTSHQAANEITASGRRAEQHAQTIAAVRAFPGCTMQELADRTGLCRYMLGRRISEVETAGLVFRGLKRCCTVTGRMAEPWFPAGEQGRAAA